MIRMPDEPFYAPNCEPDPASSKTRRAFRRAVRESRRLRHAGAGRRIRAILDSRSQGPASLAGSPGRTRRTSEVDLAGDLDQSRIEQLGRSQPGGASGHRVERGVLRDDRRVVSDVEDVEVPLRAELLR